MNISNELTGFTVYDAENGYPCGGDDDYMIDQNGKLFEITNGWRHNNIGTKMREVAEIQKEGKYIIQFGNGEMVRY